MAKKKETIKQVKKTTALTKQYSEQETKDLIKRCARLDNDPELVIQEVRENILPEVFCDNKKTSNKAVQLFQEKAEQALMSLGLETDVALAGAVGKKYQPLAMEFNRQLVKEYDCQTASEKALAQVISSAYVKIMEYSQRQHACLDIEFLSNEKNGYYTMLGKELDRANRQFTTALTTLKQLKSPALSINVKSKTAFVAQNQQLNVNQEKENKDEIIDPK